MAYDNCSPSKYCAARNAPYGNELSSPTDCKIRSGILIYYDLNETDDSDGFFSANESVFAPANLNQTGSSDSEDSRMLSDVEIASLPTGTLRSEPLFPVLPQISSNRKYPVLQSFEDLMINNGNITSDEERFLIREIRRSLGHINVEMLQKVYSELTPYDPASNGVVDSANLQGVLEHVLRGTVLSNSLMNNLFKLFARNPKKPRLINYQPMLLYIGRILDFKENDDANSNFSQSKNPMQSQQRRASFYARGDAKLIVELESSLKNAGISKLNTEKISASFRQMDSLEEGAMKVDDIKAVLNADGILDILEPVLTNLLTRCQINAESDKINWQQLVRFLDKAQPLESLADPSRPLQRKQRRDAESSIETLPGRYNGEIGGVPTQQASAVTLPVAAIVESRLKKQDLLDELNNRVGQLQLEREKLRAELDSEMKLLNGSEKYAYLIEMLYRTDQQKTGYVPIARAKKIITDTFETFNLSPNLKQIDSILALACDPSERNVSLEMLSKYLKSLL